MAKDRKRYVKRPLPGLGGSYSEAANLRGMSREFLLSEYREQRRVQVGGMTREDLEKDLVQFYMTNAYAFTDAKLRWMIAVGKAQVDLVRGIKEGDDAGKDERVQEGLAGHANDGRA